MDPRRLLAALVFLLFALTAQAQAQAQAQDQAFTNRATELKDRGAGDARTVASLPEGAAARVLERAGAWTRIEAGGQQGWVRVFHLRFPPVAQALAPSSNPLGAMTAAFGFGRETAKPTTIATTGIRGLTPEELKNATPDTAALARMHSYRADKAAAERFAREGKLVQVSVELPEGARQ